MKNQILLAILRTPCLVCNPKSHSNMFYFPTLVSDLEDSLLYSQNRHVKEECGIPVSAGMDNSPIFDLDSMAKKPWEQNKSDEGNFEQNHISKEMFEGNSSEESDIEEEEEVDFNLERVQQSGT